MEPSAPPDAPLPRVEELVLSGADVSVLNHTTLSLWHFRQLVLELLPPATASAEPEEDQAHKAPELPSSRGVELGEGMSVAAVLYEQTRNALKSEKSGLDDAELTEDNNNGTERPALQLQGITTHIHGQLTPDTRVTAVFQRYRCVICLDASPSILSIDSSSGRLFLDLLYESVELFIWSLLRPMEVGGVAFTPEIHVSVLVQGALVESLCVLMQGYIVTPSNAAGFLQLIKERFQLIENDWASQAQERGQWGYLGNATPASLDWILQNAVFSLNSLPTDCTPMIVLVTDGVVDVRDAYSYDNLLMQLVRHDIECHFLRIGGGGEDELNATFGFVPDTHLLRFVAEYTGGTVFDYAAVHEACYSTTSVCSNVVKKMTGLQDACFLRKSSVHANSAPVVKLNEMDSTSFDGRTLLPLRPYRMWRQKVHEYRIFADVNRIVEARLREGFSINKVYVKTYQQPQLIDGAGMDPPSSGGVTSNVSSGPSNDVTKILIVFLLEWKQNIWLEYVVSTTTDNSEPLPTSTSTTPHSGRRPSGQGMKGPGSSSVRKSASIFCNDQRTAWSEWYVKMNILAYADFLRAFEDTIQRSSAGRDRGAATRGPDRDGSMTSPVCIHEFIRNVQDVDRVLLHLMTATASISETSDSVANQFSFGTSAHSASAAGTPKITSSHPVFNIIGELSTVLWHRWFFVERFEILCVVKSDACTELFYRHEMHEVGERGNPGSHLRGSGKALQGIIHSHGANVYGTNSGNILIGVESLAEPLIAILVKWSSQKLSQDLFLKFIRPTAVDKNQPPPRAKASPSSATTSGGIAQRRRQRSHNNAGEDVTHGEDSISSKESKAALCFVRLEFKNKTLCAVHVAFFATRASTRRQVLNDLKNTIFAGINEVAVAPSPATLLSPSQTETPVILCHRMLSRLLVTHDTLLLHGIDQEPGPFDYYAASPTLEAEKNAGAMSPSTTCCGGSELQLHRVFGAYVWHSSWKWEVANLTALLDVMRRLHDARISCGFWVLDWKLDEGDDGGHVESVIFGREILMEDEKGHTKTALVQYALRRVSDTCLMTSFWMEPQHGIVKTRLSDEVDHTDKFHWSLKQAIGHSTPFENNESRGIHRNGTVRGTSGRISVSSTNLLEDEQKWMEQEDVSIDWSGDSTYLGESELLHLIRGYLFKSDRHFLSCLYTFDSIINLRENIELLNQLSKNVDGVVGSNWIMDRQMAAENGMILPPFSTARLLATSKRSTENFLMYLQNGQSSQSGENEPKITGILPSVSTANENLYSMLELTLRGLSDCEVSWTDYNGDVVAAYSTSASNAIEDDRFFREGMDGQLPLWLKHHLALTFKDRVPHHALSKGKCFAKLVSEDCIVLAFFPSLDTVQVKNKIPDKGASIGDIQGKLQVDERLNMPSKAPGKDGGHKIPSQQFSIRATEEDAKSRVVRMSVSADDIVLYQERRRSFREGYKSWRMGHYQGSRDDKQSYGRDFQKLRLPSTPEDHEFCEDISRRASYGCDFHLLIENADGALGSGFFQVAFYECSLSRLSTDLHDISNQMLDRVDLPHTILKQLFFSKRRDKPKEERPAIPLDRSGLWKKSPARSPTDSSGNSHPRLNSDSLLASRRFRKKVKRAHEHNFSRGVYMALREGGAVQHSDLLQALSSCIEVPVDVDITLLYRMMETAASHKIPPLSPAAAAVVSAGIGGDILKDKLTKSFETILSGVFVPIAGTKYYYFTGNENAVYEDLSVSDYDLHILMEDSDDGDGDAIIGRQKREENEHNDNAVATGEEQFSRSVDGGDPMDLRRLKSEAGEDAGEKRPIRRRRGSLRHELPPPVVTSTEESSGSEQHHTNVEEDAEFNKEVAVATSSFSVPFFFKFECRLLSSSRETRSNSADTHASGATPPEPEMLRRSSSTVAYEDMRKEMVAQAQLLSPSSRQKEFNAFLESLKPSQRSHKHSNPVDVSQIAESFSKTSSGRIALRLVTLTLPNERAFDGGRVPPQLPFEMERSGQAGKANALPSVRPHSFSTLHLFQRQVLTRVRKDVKEWCSVEILSILKSANEMTPAIGALVQRLFDDLPEDAVTKATYPLEFVARSQETPVNPFDLFKREFEKGDLLNVHHCNDVYFVVAKKSSSDKVLDSSDESEVAPAASFEIPYWAFFEIESDHVSLRLHHPDRFETSSKGVNRLEVLTRLQLGVRAVCRRVNQFLLLLQLHETRTCNGLLLPANGNLPSSPRSPKRRTGSQSTSESMGEKDGQVKQASFFWPGQFECDLRYSAFFKLHERLAPNFALNMLCTSALEQFQVHNRRHIFVYRDRDGHVFYMKISIFYDTTLLPAAGSQLTEERQERSGPARPSTGGISSGGTNTSTAVSTPAGVPGIRLEVFGVSEAGEEVTHELCRLLERKLDEATQVVLMKLLARNTKFQLSPTDLAFLCPPAAEPSSIVDYILHREVADCCTLLHYLSQTLKLAPYIRPVTTLPSRNLRDFANCSLRGARRRSLASVGSTIGWLNEEAPRAITQDTSDVTKLEEGKDALVSHNSAHMHPACFAGYQKTLAQFQENPSSLFDAATRSPVFFSKGHEVEVENDTSCVEDSASTLPEIVAQASYVLNLNPDLRLSQGFLSRVGKGLALMRIDLIRNSPIKTPTIEENTGDVESGSTQRVKHMMNIPGLAALYSNDTNSVDTVTTTLVARCQVWIRGSIHTTELTHVVEAFLDEALYDYHIEAIIKKLQSSNGKHDTSENSEEIQAVSGTQGELSSDVDTLVSLFKSACRLPSSSITSLGVNLSIAPWDLENTVAQIRSFLCCLPHHLRPAIYAKSRSSGSYKTVAGYNEGMHGKSHATDPLPDKFRLVVKFVGDPDVYEGAESSDSDAETTASMSSALHHIEPLMRTDSIHSEISDIDSVSGRMPLTWSATGANSDLNALSQIQTAPSVSSTTSSMIGVMGGLPHQPHLPKNASFSERDVLLYSSSGSSYHHHQQSLGSHEHREVKRSFYYVVDLSTSKGLRLYGYNMSSALVEGLATHIARVLTWSMLREKLLRSLLLERAGISAAAPVGSMVLQPRSLFLTVGRTERTGKGIGKNPAMLCKDSAVHFIDYRAPVLSILQSKEWFPSVLDASRLRSIDGISLGVYLREAQTQPALEALDSQYARPRGKSNTNLGVSIGPPSIPDLSREVSGPSLSQWSLHSNGDAPSNLLGNQTPGRTRSGGIVSSSNVSDSMSSSPSKRLSGPIPALPYPGGNRNEVAARMRGGAGAATALMAARARARGGSVLPGRLGSGPGVSASRGGGISGASSGVSGDNVAPWDLPLSNTKGPRLHAFSGDEADSKASTNCDGVHTDPHAGNDSGVANTMKIASKGGANRSVRRGPRGTGLSEVVSSGLAITKPSDRPKGNNDAILSDPGRIHSSWKKRLECAWGPRFLFPGNTERWATRITTEQRQHFIELEEEDQPKKNVTPLPFFCAALEKRWEAFETRSTSHTVCMNLLEKLASLHVDEEMEEPVAKDVVAHLVDSGHLLLHQRFRAAFVERWIAAEVIGLCHSEKEAVMSSRLHALQSCMDLVHLLSYKREFVFDQDECSVAKLYTEHTVLSMGAGAGADVRGIKQQVAANLEPLRLEVASEFYKEYAVHLRTLGFRRLRTLHNGRSHARAFPVNHDVATTENEIPDAEGFSEYFYHPERAAAEAGGWKVDASNTSNDAQPLSIVVLEVKCDNRGVRLTAVLVSLHDLEQQDLRFQNRLAAKAGKRVTGTSGARVQSVASWLRAQLQTQALIYGFTIRYFQQHLLEWIRASHAFHDGQNGQGHSVGKHLSEDDALVVTPPMSWKNASTFQNIVKGLQCFLHAFPDPPVEPQKPRAPASLSSPVAGNSASKTATPKINDRRASSISPPAASGNDGHRPTSRAAARFARRAISKQHQQQGATHHHLAPTRPDTKPAAPLSLLWRDCVIRVATVTLQPTSLQSNCSELIMVQILLRYIACHGSRYEVLDLLQFGTPDAVVCHSSSGSFYHRPPSTITPSTPIRKVKPSGGYSLVITTQPLTRKPLDKDSVQLLLLKSTHSELGVGNGVLPAERALQEAQLFTRELFRVAAQHYERDLLWSRLLFDDSRGPGADVARTLALPPDLFRVEVGPQQLEECLRLSICTPLETLDPRLDELLRVPGVCWQELALRLRDIYADQLREFEFQEEDEKSSHLLLLCPDTFDLIIHLTFITPKDPVIPPEQGENRVSGDESIDSSSRSASLNGSHVSSISEHLSDGGFEDEAEGDVRVEICRREEPTNKQFTFAQRRSISEFVNSIVHWQWRSLIYD